MAEVTFSFDDLNILSCNEKDEVILKCHDDKFDDCILFVPREMFTNMLQEWLNRKQAYYKLWKGDFCGVGYVLVKAKKIAPKRIGHITYLIDYVEEGDELKEVTRSLRGFIALDFDVDMEHG